MFKSKLTPMSLWSDPELTELFLNQTPLIDVRAPVEFVSGSVPNAINLPLLNDEERRLVGICYKELGQAKAIELGHKLVSGATKEQRIKAWLYAIQQKPNTQVFCFRGGMRSQISCQWISEAGIKRIPISGGYKRMRSFFISRLEEAPLPDMWRISGLTGCGKTKVLKNIKSAVDLEALANHRGSAFGENGPQPTQINFENELALKLMQQGSTIVVEDESAMIGRITIPKRFHAKMRTSPVVLLNTQEEDRLQNIFEDYVLPLSSEQLMHSLKRIEKALGGVRFKEVIEALERALSSEKILKNHERWISLLLHYYYDPAYTRGMDKQKKYIKFEGDASEVLDFIQSQ
jgi:tRNA 2-selenouridine synthase